jgi:hypothetical protein
MPPKAKPKKVVKRKPKRVPHADETPMKDRQPGHGTVERGSHHMWGPSSSSTQQSSSGGFLGRAGGAKPKYKATTISIGRSGRGGNKQAASSAAVSAAESTTTTTAAVSSGNAVRAARQALTKAKADADDSFMPSRAQKDAIARAQKAVEEAQAVEEEAQVSALVEENTGADPGSAAAGLDLGPLTLA